MSPERIRPGSARGRSPAHDGAEAPAAGTEEAGWAPTAAGIGDGGAAEAPAVEAPAVEAPAVEAVAVEAPAVEAVAVEAATPSTAAKTAPDRDGATPGVPEPLSAPALAPRHRGFFRRLYYGESSFDFVGRRRIWLTVSTLVILAGVVSLATRGLNLDIEFVGGTSWTVQWPSANVTQARDALAPFNLSGSTITILGQPGSATHSLQVEAKIPKGQTAAQTQDQLVKVEDTLAGLAHLSSESVSIESVGPSWGSQVTDKAIEALVVFFVLVALYISLFFEWRMALAAIIAVLHDILVVVGIYSLTGFDVTPDTVVAILTILGYSLYDTIVVFDRIRDNLRGVGAGGRLTISDLVNLSMNQTLARSINTSFVAILPIFAVLILGAEILGATTLQYFGWALLIGLTSGAYSSIFVASPIVAMLKEREPRWQRVRERVVQRGGEHMVLSPAALAAGLFAGEGGPSGVGRVRGARAAAASGDAGSSVASERPARGSSSARQPSGRPGARPAGRSGGGARRKGGRR